MFDQQRPYIDQMSADSPYRVAALQQLANFPNSLILSGATTTPQSQLPSGLSALLGSTAQATGASGLGAATNAGLSKAQIKALTQNGVKI